MRKIVSVFVMVFVMAMASVTFAENGYPDYLGGDKNYVMCDGHMGTGYYVDRSSLQVKQYTPPSYMIAVNVATVPDADAGKIKISNVRTYYFMYRYDQRNMYVPMTDPNSDLDWRYLKPRGSYAETGVAMPAGEIAFYLAYNMRFYGERAGFKDSFYDRI